MSLLRLILVLLVAVSPAAAATRPYVLDGDASQVAFLWEFGPDTVRGRMAVAAAEMMLDLDNVGASRVSVAVDATQADAGFPFATQAMTGPRVLHTAVHPLITFQSRRVTLIGDGHAQIEGDITIRGVTQPITLDARLTSRTADLSHLTLALSGVVHRSDFGATGWADMVGDDVRLEIAAALHAAE